MTRQELVAFLRSHRHATVASVAADGTPQSAVVGIAVTDACEVVFDTLGDTRKVANLRRDPRAALVVWSGERTAQLEGLADEPEGEELARLKRAYFEAFPDGVAREAWEGITYVRVRPSWARFSDFGDPVRVVELDASVLMPA